MIPEYIFVQAEGILKPMNFTIDPAPCRKNPTKKNKIVIPNCPPLLPGENYTEVKAWQLKFASSDPYYEELH